MGSSMKPDGIGIFVAFEFAEFTEFFELAG
jgi:hypothetical protein